MSGLDTEVPELADIALPLERLYRWERERADKPFLTQPYGGGRLREWTWSEAAREIRRMAGYLKAQNWEPGTRVAILSKNCAWWVMADLAIWMAGHVTVPVYPSLRAATVRRILEHSESKACFLGATDEPEAAMAGIPAGVRLIHFPTAEDGPGRDWDAVVAESAAIEGNPTREAGELATIFYTSGTTGAPKGVMHHFTALSFFTSTLVREFDLSGEHRILSYLPMCHILEREGQEMPAILLGWHIYFTEGLETFLTDLQRARPSSIFLAVPRVLLKLQQGVYAKIPRKKLERLLRIPVVGRIVRKKILHQLGLDVVRFAACGSAPLPPENLMWYRRLGLNLLEGYGLTEGMITHLTKQGKTIPGYAGSPLYGVETKRAENGELLVRSAMNMIGYYKEPEATRDAFTEDGFLHTGDIVEVEPEGQIKIVGRIKEQFKTSKGKYVAPAPIETKLAAHPDVESCCLMGAGLPGPFAVIVLSPEARQRCADPARKKELEQSFQKLLEQVNAQLETHERVLFAAIVEGPWTIGNGMMTPTLKLKRSTVETQYMALVDFWKSQERMVVWEAEAKTRHAGAD